MAKQQPADVVVHRGPLLGLDARSPLGRLAGVEGILHDDVLPGVKVLDALQSPELLKHILGANMCLWTAIKKAATRLQQVARNIDVMMRKVIQARLQTVEDGGGRAGAELDQLGEEPNVLDLGLDIDWVLLLKEVIELLLQARHQRRPNVLQVHVEGSCQARVVWEKLQLVALDAQHRLDKLLAIGFGIEIAELHRPRVNQVATYTLGQAAQ
mmetsp:Transcript_40062/g.64981  ORF Transcript_40062/g.64981 Transcript_40062/m.64981 type:complete len:212 (-) Transcript_40062:2267-2902(-)